MRVGDSLVGMEATDFFQQTVGEITAVEFYHTAKEIEQRCPNPGPKAGSFGHAFFIA